MLTLSVLGGLLVLARADLPRSRFLAARVQFADSVSSTFRTTFETSRTIPSPPCYAGGENDASFESLAGAVSVFRNHISFGLELLCGENSGQMAAVVSPLQVRRIVTVRPTGWRVEAH